MNAIRNLHEVRFSNIYILPKIIYYVFPLTVINVLALKTVGFSKVRQSLSNIFAAHYGDVEDETLYSFGIFYYFRLKNLLLHG